MGTIKIDYLPFHMIDKFWWLQILPSWNPVFHSMSILQSIREDIINKKKGHDIVDLDVGIDLMIPREAEVYKIVARAACGS